MTIPDILAEMKTLLSRRADVEKGIARLRLIGYGCRSHVPDGMPRGAPLRPEAMEIAERLDALMDELEAIEQDLAAFRRRLEPAIRAIPDGPQRMMLRLRYIHWLPVAEAAKEAGYERKYAYKLLDDGEKAISSA